jgi:glycosyltransferase involved in cell wall biosynthesis
VKLGSRVGVVIPTRNRPQLAKRAVESALAQTHRELDVVVVIDGPDDATQQILTAICDKRLTVTVTPQRGASAARNIGVRMLSTDWIAFLDDDDIWQPTKLETQLRAATLSTASTLVLSCRARRETVNGSRIEPRRLPRAHEPVSEFLFHPSGLSLSRGYIQTSTLLAPRTLALSQPFDEALPLHEDWDWTLRAVQRSDVQLVLLPDVLVTVDQNSQHGRLSTSTDWRYSLDWIKQRRTLVTDRAYSGFISSVVAAKAARSHAGAQELWHLMKAAARGRLSPSHVMTLIIWLVFPDRLIKFLGRITEPLWGRRGRPSP